MLSKKFFLILTLTITAIILFIWSSSAAQNSTARDTWYAGEIK